MIIHSVTIDLPVFYPASVWLTISFVLIAYIIVRFFLRT